MPLNEKCHSCAAYTGSPYISLNLAFIALIWPPKIASALGGPVGLVGSPKNAIARLPREDKDLITSQLLYRVCPSRDGHGVYRA
jgi:hypothetical protein